MLTSTSPTDEALPASHSGWAVRLSPGGVIIGTRVPPTRAGRPLGALQGRAARRIAELAALASWRARFGVVSDPAGWAAVAADALAELQGVGAWRCDAAGIAAQLPPGTEDAAAAIADALAAPHRPGRLLSGREAGLLVELVVLEADDDDMGAVITTLTPRDLGDDELAVSRLSRRRDGTRERMRKLRANSVTTRNVTSQTRSNVTSARDAPSILMPRHRQDVTNSLPDGVITATSVATDLGIAAGAARVRLVRWKRAGLIISVGRGRYRVAGGEP